MKQLDKCCKSDAYLNKIGYKLEKVNDSTLMIVNDLKHTVKVCCFFEYLKNISYFQIRAYYWQKTLPFSSKNI